jgi:hypothetical protein
MDVPMTKICLDTTILVATKYESEGVVDIRICYGEFGKNKVIQL